MSDENSDALSFATNERMLKYYGRRPVYIYSYFVYLCLLAVSALAPNLAVFLPVRLLSGYFASVTIGKDWDVCDTVSCPGLLTSNSKLRGDHRRSLSPSRYWSGYVLVPLGGHLRISVWLLYDVLCGPPQRLARRLLGLACYLWQPMGYHDGLTNILW